MSILCLRILPTTPIVNRAELASGDAGIEVRLELFDGRKMELIYSRNY